VHKQGNTGLRNYEFGRPGKGSKVLAEPDSASASAKQLCDDAVGPRVARPNPSHDLISHLLCENVSHFTSVCKAISPGFRPESHQTASSAGDHSERH
jgi:hypothetical protein